MAITSSGLAALGVPEGSLHPGGVAGGDGRAVSYPVFFNAKAMDTLEFLQRDWINNGNFMGLGDERDPNVGLQEDGATFTILRRRCGAEFTASRPQPITGWRVLLPVVTFGVAVVGEER